MAGHSPLPVSVRFGPFELSSESGEIRKNGTRLKLSGQPIEVLRLLLEHPGRLVTREEIQQKLWPSNSYGDFEHGLNAAVNRLRETLGDSATEPKYIDTLPRRGYRFIAAVEATPLVSESRAVEPAGKREGETAVAVHPVRRFMPGRKASWIAGTAFLLLVAVVLYEKSFPRAEGSMREVEVTPFTTFKGREISPSFSPDGSQIVFAWDGGKDSGEDRFDLYIKVVGSENVVQLTSKPSAWLVPAWSPDGRTIAFARSASGESGIFSVPALGGRERRLAGAVFKYAPLMSLNWSPDGKRLTYATSDGRAHILYPDSGELVDLERPSRCIEVYSPAFSPSGDWLAFNCCFNYVDYGIFVMPSGGGPARQLTAESGNPIPLTWSADSQWIIFPKQNTLADEGLWEISPKTGKMQRTLFAQAAGQPNTALHGNRLAYTQTNDNVNIWALDLTSEGKLSPTVLVSSTRQQRAGNISPDGTRIVFESNRSGPGEVWFSDVGGGNAVQLSNFHSLTGTPRWSPDGRQIVFDSRVRGAPALYLVDPAAGVPKQIPIKSLDGSVPSWSRDGKWIYFTSGEAGSGSLYKVSREGGAPILITKTAGYNAQESEDGKSLYFMAGETDAEIRVISGAGGKEQSINGMPKLRCFSDWALDTKGIFFIDRESNPAAIRFFEFATAKVRKITELNRPPEMWGGLYISRDRKRLTFALANASSDIMVAENYR
jgi:Tol biopolymer transport system component/DNA-binding winged helix-turn-helix (wHTH) protein